MKKMIWCTVVIVIAVISLSLFFNSCSLDNEPASRKEIEKQFLSSYNDIVLVTNYMLSLPYEDMSIREYEKGKYLADLVLHEIEDKQVKAAVRRLQKNGIFSIEKNSEFNSIAFRIWRSYRQIDCGILYAIDADCDPSVQYLTYLEPLDVSPWYYYIVDFNMWKIAN